MIDAIQAGPELRELEEGAAGRKAKRMADKTYANLFIPKELVDKIDAIRDGFGFKSRTEVVRLSVHLFLRAMDAYGRGAILITAAEARALGWEEMFPKRSGRR